MLGLLVTEVWGQRETRSPRFAPVRAPLSLFFITFQQAGRHYLTFHSCFTCPASPSSWINAHGIFCLGVPVCSFPAKKQRSALYPYTALKTEVVRLTFPLTREPTNYVFLLYFKFLHFLRAEPSKPDGGGFVGSFLSSHKEHSDAFDTPRLK